MSLLRSASTRRAFLAAGVATVGDLALAGCHHGMAIFKTGTLAPPPGVPTDSALTIDVHCHIFNGSDLQVEKFFGDIVFPTWWGKAAGEILQIASQAHAPSGSEEISKLKKLLDGCSSSDGKTWVSETAQQQLGQFREDGFQRARAAVLAVQQNSSPRALAPGNEMLTLRLNSNDDAKQQIFNTFSTAKTNDDLQRILNAPPPPLTENQNREFSLSIGGGTSPFDAVAKTSKDAQPFNFKGAIQFIVQYFQYRYVSAQDYLNIFTPNAHRDVDLMLPSLVDFDWWLAKGNPTPTNLDVQAQAMKLISILSDGRIHGFAPFCPLREVAARAGLKNRHGELAKSSLAFVQNAVRTQGFVGVKLYPPMGFAAYGNCVLDDPLHGGRADFWKTNLLPDWASKDIRYSDGTSERLGNRLDGALDDLYTWCVKEDIPIMAHTEETNGPSDAYKELAGSKHWKCALTRYPGLRVNFGHLGGINDSTGNVQLPAESKAFVAMMGSPSPNAYGDVAFSSNLIMGGSNFKERIQTAYGQSSDPSRLPSHLMYGTDWSLLEQIGNNDRYMQGFADVFAPINSKACSSHSAEDCFFGWNAAEYLGLKPPNEGTVNTRSRLEAFYKDNCMPNPAWMQKMIKT